MKDPITTAETLHRQGNLARAAAVYEQILAGDQRNTAALHGLGVLHYQHGNHQAALDLLSRAVDARPDDPRHHVSLSHVCREAGQLQRSAEHGRRAVALAPHDADAQNNLGLTLQSLGLHSEAIACFSRAIELRPALPAAHTGWGISLGALGRRDEALAHLRRAVELEPQFAPWHSNLGLMLLESGRPAEALAPCQNAVQLQPGEATFHHNLGHVLRGLGRQPEACAAYAEAVRLAPQFAAAHAALGLLWLEQGDPRQAIPHLARAVELDPNQLAIWEHLGRLYSQLQMPSEAARCWRRVITLAPDRFEARMALASVLYYDGQLAEAAQQCRAALALRGDSAAAHHSLGMAHEDLGDFDQAISEYRAAIELQPDFAAPLARMVTLLRRELPEHDFAAIKARVATPPAQPAMESELRFALGSVLDARGDYAAAAQQFCQANARAVEANRAGRLYNAPSHERFVDGLIRLCNRDFFARLAGAGADSRRPVFIFGLPRSGTTLVEQVFASHSAVFGAGELTLAPRLFNTLPDVVDRAEPPLACLGYLDAGGVRVLADRHLEALAAIDAGHAQRIVDKTPDNYLYLGLLTVLFPNAVFIHCRRELRDVALSCWTTDFRTLRWTNDVEHLVSRLQQYRRIMDHWQSVLPATIQHVDYEDAVADLEGVARRLVAACGLDWQPACLEFHRTSRPIRTASSTQVRRPIYNSSVGRWKHYETELSDLFARLDDK